MKVNYKLSNAEICKSFNKEIICYKCGRAGHMARDCRVKQIYQSQRNEIINDQYQVIGNQVETLKQC